MSKVYDVCSARARKNSDKPYWHRIGAVWEGRNGLVLTLDSLPLPNAEGQVILSLFVPKEKDAGQQTAQGGVTGHLDDEVPF